MIVETEVEEPPRPADAAPCGDQPARLAPFPNGSVAAAAHDHAAGGPEHIVQFYEADGALVDALETYIGDALRSGEAAIVVATPPHVADLDDRLGRAGVDVAACRAAGQYIALDAAATLASITVGSEDMPDRDRFDAVIGSLIGRATARPAIRVFGEMVALQAQAGHHAAALLLEEFWNDAQRSCPFSLLCAYPLQQFGDDGLGEFLGGVCASHSRVVPAESYTRLRTPDSRSRAIAALQRKALSLTSEIERRERAEEQLRAALAAEQTARLEAEAALCARDNFLALAAHELRTPLTGLTGRAQLLQRQLKRDRALAPERVEQALQVVTSRANTLARLLDQLLDVSRLEAGQVRLERRPTDLAGLVGRVVSAARADAAVAPRAIGVDIPKSLPLVADGLRLEQTLTILLDWAARQSPVDARIDIVLRRTGAAAELTVRDHGAAIPAEQRAQLFEPYAQDTGPGVRHGLGLGLYIARQIAQLHGGEILAEFPPDGGTRFILRLPLAQPAPAMELSA